jgi:hypothetical protein
LILLLKIQGVEPKILPAPLVPLILFIINLLYTLDKMNIPNIAATEIGNGNNKEMIKIIPKDIPIHTS